MTAIIIELADYYVNNKLIKLLFVNFDKNSIYLDK